MHYVCCVRIIGVAFASKWRHITSAHLAINCSVKDVTLWGIREKKVSGVLGHNADLYDYSGQGITWANKMNFIMNLAPGAGPITRPVTCSLACYRCTMPTPSVSICMNVFSSCICPPSMHSDVNWFCKAGKILGNGSPPITKMFMYVFQEEDDLR